MLLKREHYEFKINFIGENLAEVDLTIPSLLRTFKGLLPNKILREGFHEFKLLEKLISELNDNHDSCQFVYRPSLNTISLTIFNVVISDEYCVQVDVSLNEYIGVIDENDEDIERLIRRQKYKIDLQTNKLRAINRKLKEIEELMDEVKM
jgi:hypothetical protein